MIQQLGSLGPPPPPIPPPSLNRRRRTNRRHDGLERRVSCVAPNFFENTRDRVQHRVSFPLALVMNRLFSRRQISSFPLLAALNRDNSSSGYESLWEVEEKVEEEEKEEEEEEEEEEEGEEDESVALLETGTYGKRDLWCVSWTAARSKNGTPCKSRALGGTCFRNGSSSRFCVYTWQDKKMERDRNPMFLQFVGDKTNWIFTIHRLCVYNMEFGY